MPEIDGYSDLARVARGGFAVVYRARQDWFDRIVALKVLSVDDLDDRSRQRFERECRAMGSLSWHPNVVAVLDSGIADGHPWMAMEYLDAGSLGDRLDRAGPLPWPYALTVGVHVAGALGAAHASGVLHRDLKPENLLIGPFGEAKLADFGIAAVEGAVRTTTGNASFTVAHVAPEVIEGRPPDERSDLYGLASTLHTLISGAAPFTSRTDESIATIIARVLHAPAPRLSDVPDDLADLVERTLAKDPDERPPSAEALGQALQRVQADNGEPVTELRLAPTASVVAPTARATRPVGPTGAADGPLVGDDAPPTVHDALSAGLAADDRTVGEPLPTVHRSATPPTPGQQLADAAPRPTSTEPASPDATRPRPDRRGRRPIVAAVAAVAAAIGAVILATALGGGNDTAGPVGADDPVPGTPEVTDVIDVGDNPVGVAATDDAVWVTNANDATVTRIDPATNAVTDTIDVGTKPVGVAATDDAVWVTNADDGTLTRIDPATNDVTDTLVGVGAGPVGVAATDDAVWVTNLDGTVTRIDPATNAVTDTIVIGNLLREVAATGRAVWVTTLAGTVTRIDPATNAVTDTIEIADNDVYEVAATNQGVWITNFGSGTLTRIDPATNDVTDTIEVGTSPFGVAARNDAVWVTNAYVDTVTRVDPGTS